MTDPRFASVSQFPALPHFSRDDHAGLTAGLANHLSSETPRPSGASATDAQADRLAFRVAVIGLGRVGLPHALVSARAGNRVVGIESNLATVRSLRRGQAHFSEPGLATLLREHVGERFQVREDLAAIEQTDVVVVAIGVQAPEGQERVDLGPLERLFDALGPHSAGKLVILRTTVPVGTTAALKIRLEGISGLREGSDFDLVFCPERVVEGQAVEEEVRLPKIVGAFGSRGFRRAKAYLETIGGEVVPVRNPSTAEIVKLTDNSWRQLRFAFSNDLALACESLGLDVLDVLAAANRGYSRNGIPLPSCGVSGYCLTKDPRFLDMSFGEVERTRGFGSVWGAARQSNDYMVRHTYQKALRLAEQYKRSVRPVRAVVAGLAYKEDCDDFRMSHGPELAAMLANDPRFEVTVFDPYLATFHDNPYLSLPGGASGRIRAATSLSESLVDRDLAIFTVPHKEFLLEASNGGLNHLAETTRKPFVVIDGWNIFARNCGSVESGVVYRGLGRD